MQCLIITGGSIEYNFAIKYIEERMWDYIICADAGMKFCHKAGIIPDLILGDFDSVDQESYECFNAICPERMERFPSHKDETDTELALLRAIEAGADAVTMIGATGTRLDHVMGNIQILKKALDRGITTYLVDSHNRIRMTDTAVTISKEEQFGTYVSLIPFTEKVTGLTLCGFSYPVQDYTLMQGRSVGVSNEITGQQGEISLKEGLLLVMESRD